MYDTIIIGAGISGLTAALYASRKRMKFEVLASEFGGQCMVSGEVLNYPGIIKTTGVEFAFTLQKQMEFNNVDVKTEKVLAVKKLSDSQPTTFEVQTDKQVYQTKTVIIATGARAKKLEIPGEEEFAKKGVTYCSICDGPLFAGKEVAVVGGGDAALEAVDFLKDIVNKIYFLVRSGSFTGYEYLIERVMENPKVEVLFNSSITEITGEQFVSGITYKTGNEKKTLNVSGVIIEIGREPNTEVFKEFLDVDEHNHISIDCQTYTSVPGVFAAGDCASGHEYQYVIAAGQGCMALIKAARYLAHLKQNTLNAKGGK